MKLLSGIFHWIYFRKNRIMYGNITNSSICIFAFEYLWDLMGFVFETRYVIQYTYSCDKAKLMKLF